MFDLDLYTGLTSDIIYKEKLDWKTLIEKIFNYPADVCFLEAIMEMNEI